MSKHRKYQSMTGMVMLCGCLSLNQIAVAATAGSSSTGVAGSSPSINSSGTTNATSCPGCSSSGGTTTPSTGGGGGTTTPTGTGGGGGTTPSTGSTTPSTGTTTSSTGNTGSSSTESNTNSASSASSSDNTGSSFGSERSSDSEGTNSRDGTHRMYDQSARRQVTKTPAVPVQQEEEGTVEPLEEAKDQPLTRYRPDTVVVTYHGCQAVGSPSASMSVSGSSCSGSGNLQTVTYRLNGISVTNAIEQLRNRSDVAAVQPDFYYQLAAADATAGNSTAGNSTDYPRRLIKLDNAPKNYTGKGVTVGIIDSLIDTKHKELINDNVKQFNLFDFKETDKHATAISGILLGKHRILGITPEVRLVSVPAFYIDKQKRRVSSTFYIAQALEKMLEQDIQLLNLSFVGHKDEMVERLIRALQKKGVIVVAAAGNAGGESERVYPAAYPSVIGVTAVDARKQLYQLATTGNHVDYAAPGVQLLALAPRSRYSLVSGTSFATAYATGLLALLKQDGDSNQKVLQILRQYSEDLGRAGYDTQFGNGLIESPW